MDRERAETHLRLLAEAELRRVMAMRAGRIRDRWYSANLLLVAQALTAVRAVGADVVDALRADVGFAVAARHQLAVRGRTPEHSAPEHSAPEHSAPEHSAPEHIQSAPRRTWWRVVPVGQVINIRDGDQHRDLLLVAYMQSAGGARFIAAEWPFRPFTCTAADDRGVTYQIVWAGEMAPRELRLRPDPPRRIRWLDLTTATGEPATRVDLGPRNPVPDVTVTRHAHSPGEVLLDALAARILTDAAHFSQNHPGQSAAASPRLLALGDGPGHVVSALHAAGALPPDSPVPGQLAGLCARLGISGHGITALPASDLPTRWQSVLTYPREPHPPPAARLLSATVAELPELDGAKIAIAGVHHGARGTIMHLLATGVTLEAGWPYAVRPLPALWIRDSAGHWHVTCTDDIVSPWGAGGANPWTDTCMVTAWLTIIPPLDRRITWIEISVAGESGQVRAILPLSSP